MKNQLPPHRPLAPIHHLALAAGAMCLLVLLPSGARANGPPIQGETAFTTGLNGAAVRTFLKVTRKHGAMGRLYAYAVPIVIPYEVMDNKLVIGLGLPLLYKELLLADGATRSAGFGVGDLLVFGKLNLYQKDVKRGTFRLAFKAGFTLPTGAHNIADSLGTLPLGLQRGTGSVNPSIMLIATKLWRRVGLNFDVGYTVFPEVDGVNRSDVLRYDVSASFRVLPWVYRTYPAHQLNLVLELNGSWASKATLSGVATPDSGGHVLFVSPGVQYMYDRIIVEVSVQIPIPGATRLNGSQLTPDWTVLAGARVLVF